MKTLIEIQEIAKELYPTKGHTVKAFEDAQANRNAFCDGVKWQQAKPLEIPERVLKVIINSSFLFGANFENYTGKNLSEKYWKIEADKKKAEMFKTIQRQLKTGEI